MNPSSPQSTPDHPPLTVSTLVATYSGALLLAALITWLTTRFDQHPGARTAVLLGWGVAVFGACVGSSIKIIALRGDFNWFLIWALGINGIRALIFVAIIVAAHQQGMAHFRPFLIAALSGYFCCLFGEVLLLHIISLRNWSME